MNQNNLLYDVESLFTNMPIEETINYIIEQIYVHKRLTPICSTLIFRRLLIKLAIECTFKLNSRFFKQVDGCIMGGPWPVTCDVITQSKSIFYRRFADDIYSIQKLEDNVFV